MSSRLTSESRIYADKAKDLNQQVSFSKKLMLCGSLFLVNGVAAGQVEKLKVYECKVYLRKHRLQLSGNKDVLIQRIKEHLDVEKHQEQKEIDLSELNEKIYETVEKIIKGREAESRSMQGLFEEAPIAIKWKERCAYSAYKGASRDFKCWR
ncbi:hypothetical protein SLEP1_g54554 [Rubroshorea leprosula]|uniref:SAP domain-containing protein n=1 Tax=Rubroshorea leprosula TaxID=152421 RepID=A0AAV5MGH9_9ROSI|nr:hypothetical protein SLEP1_g54554 [Rubroshorea leprosula]